MLTTLVIGEGEDIDSYVEPVKGFIFIYFVFSKRASRNQCVEVIFSLNHHQLCRGNLLPCPHAFQNPHPKILHDNVYNTKL